MKKSKVIAALLVGLSMNAFAEFNEAEYWANFGSEHLPEGYKPNQEEVIADRELRAEAQEVCEASGAAWAAYGRALLKNGKQAHGAGAHAAYESTPPWWENSKRGEVTRVVAQIWKNQMHVDSSGSFGKRWQQNTSNTQMLNNFKSNFSSDLATKSFVKGCLENL